MSFTLVRLACFRLGMAPLNPKMRGQNARTALPRTNRNIRPENCPGISGITVPYLLKSLSATHRNCCPRFSETRSFIEHLVPEPTIERFNECVLHRLSRSDIMPVNLVPIGEPQDGIRGELGAVVADHHLW